MLRKKVEQCRRFLGRDLHFNILGRSPFARWLRHIKGHGIYANILTVICSFLLASICFATSIDPSSSEDVKTIGLSCYDVGYRYSRAATSMKNGKRVHSSWVFPIPTRCKNDLATEKGMQAGKRDSTAKPKVKEGRRFSSEECARMELALPLAARHIGMRRGYSDAVDTKTKSDFPEATEAMLVWLAGYNTASLLRYPFEMASDFGKQCERGKIRALVDSK